MKSSVTDAIEAQVSHFQSRGRSIRIESFPVDQVGAPSVVLLHGANGVRFANPVISGLVQYMAVQGLSVHLVRYFDSTETVYADDRTIHVHFDTWLRVVEDAVANLVERNPGTKFGIFGHSLGGFLAAARSVRCDHLRCAVILSGGIDEVSAMTLRRTAPTLILHGAEDRRVPISEARRLEATLTAAGSPPEIHVYPGEGHLLQMASYVDALHRSTEFILRHLA